MEETLKMDMIATWHQWHACFCKEGASRSVEAARDLCDRRYCTCCQVGYTYRGKSCGIPWNACPMLGLLVRWSIQPQISLTPQLEG